ncbi:spore coat protein U domain-containing protein [Mangrovibacter sp. SLW1]
MKVKNIAYACVLAAFSFASQADDNTSMHVTLEVMKSCSLSASDMDFAQRSSADTSEITASSELNIACTKGTPGNLPQIRQIRPAAHSTCIHRAV